MAVYTDVTDEALASFLHEYDIGALIAFRGIAEGVENSNFSLRTSAGDFILTLYEKRVDAAELPWFLGLMCHLAAAGISCPLPVVGRDGGALRSLAGRPAAITSFLPGVWPRRIRAEHCSALGETLGRLHLAGLGYAPVRRNALGPHAWAGLLDRSRDSADTVQKGLVEELDAALSRIVPRWPGPEAPRGQIHADLFPDNVFFLNHAISGVIDFYFACTDLLAYDLAVCLNAWCFEPAMAGQAWRFDRAKAGLLTRGYNCVRPLTGAERDALPVLAAGAAMRFLLTRLYDWLHHPSGALVTPKDPLDTLRRLRFHLTVEDAGVYGL